MNFIIIRESSCSTHKCEAASRSPQLDSSVYSTVCASSIGWDNFTHKCKSGKLEKFLCFNT